MGKDGWLRRGEFSSASLKGHLKRDLYFERLKPGCPMGDSPGWIHNSNLGTSDLTFTLNCDCGGKEEKVLLLTRLSLRLLTSAPILTITRLITYSYIQDLKANLSENPPLW